MLLKFFKQIWSICEDGTSLIDGIFNSLSKSCICKLSWPFCLWYQNDTFRGMGCQALLIGGKYNYILPGLAIPGAVAICVAS